MSRIVLDAGALLALERRDLRIWGALKNQFREKSPVLIPSTALAQAWRGTASQVLLAMAVDRCVIAPFDVMAREVGVLCGQARTRDICDAHVALVTAQHGDVLYTSDPGDLERLLAHLGRRRPAVIRC